MNNKTFLRRNLDLWEDRRIFGKTYKELSIKYCITVERCRQIFMKVERRYCNYLNCLKGSSKLKLHSLEKQYFNRAIAIERSKENNVYK